MSTVVVETLYQESCKDGDYKCQLRNLQRLSEYIKYQFDQQTTDYNDNLVAGLADTRNRIQQTTYDQLQNVKDILQRNLQDIFSQAYNNNIAVNNNLNDINNTMTDVSTTVEGVNKNLMNITSNINNAIDDALIGVNDKIISSVNNALNNFSTVGDNIANTISNNITEISNKTNTTIEKINDTIKEKSNVELDAISDRTAWVENSIITNNIKSTEIITNSIQRSNTLIQENISHLTSQLSNTDKDFRSFILELYLDFKSFISDNYIVNVDNIAKQQIDNALASEIAITKMIARMRGTS